MNSVVAWFVQTAEIVCCVWLLPGERDVRFAESEVAATGREKWERRGLGERGKRCARGTPCRTGAD